MRHGIARITRASARFLFPAQPDGGFRGKAPSAYSELRFKLKVYIGETVRRPRSAGKKMELRALECRIFQPRPIFLDRVTSDKMRGRNKQFVRAICGKCSFPHDVTQAFL